MLVVIAKGEDWVQTISRRLKEREVYTSYLKNT